MATPFTWLFEPGALADQIITLCNLLQREFGHAHHKKDGDEDRRRWEQQLIHRWDLCLRSLSGPPLEQGHCDAVLCLVPRDGILHRPRSEELEKVLCRDNEHGCDAHGWQNCCALMIAVGVYAHVRILGDEGALEIGTRALTLARELAHHAAMKGEHEVMELLQVGSDDDVFATLLDVVSNRTLARVVRELSLDVCLAAVSSRLYCANSNKSVVISSVEPERAATFVQVALELLCEDTPPRNPLEWITGSGSWVADALHQDVARPRWVATGVEDINPVREKRISRFLHRMEAIDTARRFPGKHSGNNLTARGENKFEASLRDARCSLPDARLVGLNAQLAKHRYTSAKQLGNSDPPQIVSSKSVASNAPLYGVHGRRCSIAWPLPPRQAVPTQLTDRYGKRDSLADKALALLLVLVAAPGDSRNPFAASFEAIKEAEKTDTDLPLPPPRAGCVLADLDSVISSIVARAHTEPAVLLLHNLLRSNSAFRTRIQVSVSELLEPLVERLLYCGSAASTSEIVCRIQCLGELAPIADWTSSPKVTQCNWQGGLALLAITRCLVDNLALFHDDNLAEACYAALYQIAPHVVRIPINAAHELAKAMRGALRRYIRGDAADRVIYAKATKVLLMAFNMMLRSQSHAASNLPLLGELARLHRELGPTWATLPEADAHWLQVLPKQGEYFANVLEDHFEGNPHQSQNFESRAAVLKAALPGAPQTLFLHSVCGMVDDVNMPGDGHHLDKPLRKIGEAYSWEVIYTTTRNDIMWDPKRIRLFDLLILKHGIPRDKSSH